MVRTSALALALVLPGAAQAQPQILSNRWDSAEPSSFNHVLQAAPGTRILRLDAVAAAGGPVVVSVYPRTPDGGRGEPRLLSAQATRDGDSRAAAVQLPPAARGQALGRLPIVVVVENAAKARSAGEYTLTLAP